MDLIGLLAQVIMFFIFMLAANYFFMQRKHANRLKISFLASGIAAVLYAIAMYFWRVA